MELKGVLSFVAVGFQKVYLCKFNSKYITLVINNVSTYYFIYQSKSKTIYLQV